MIFWTEDEQREEAMQEARYEQEIEWRDAAIQYGNDNGLIVPDKDSDFWNEDILNGATTFDQVLDNLQSLSDWLRTQQGASQ